MTPPLLLTWSHDLDPEEGMVTCDRCGTTVAPVESFRGTGDEGCLLVRMLLVGQGWFCDDAHNFDLCPECLPATMAHTTPERIAQ